MLARLFLDRFIFILFGVIALAAILPARGAALDLVGHISNIAIFAMFFFHGLRLKHAAVWEGLKNWRLHLIILAMSFGVFPLLGLAVSGLGGLILPSALVAGLFFLAVLPSTVQSAIAYSSIAGGNVAVSVIAAALSNLLAILFTPALLTLIGQGGGIAIDASAISRIATLLLLPFILGQLAQVALSAWADRNAGWISKLDRLTIAIAVYTAFSGAVVEGVWRQLSMADVAALTGIVVLLLGAAMLVAWQLGSVAGLPRPDRISLLFAGSHKSLATGAPMARIFYPGAEAGLMILPLILYHQLQLIASALIAPRLAQDENGAHS